jgi:hypothetical protein
MTGRSIRSDLYSVPLRARNNLLRGVRALIAADPCTFARAGGRIRMHRWADGASIRAAQYPSISSTSDANLWRADRAVCARWFDNRTHPHMPMCGSS